MLDHLPDFPTRPGWQHTLGQVIPQARGLCINQILVHRLDNSSGLTIVLTEDSHTATQLGRELGYFQPSLPVFTLPDWETLPYDHFSPHQEIIAERLTTLYQLPRQEKGILILPVSSLLQRLPPVSFLEGQCFVYRRGQQFNLEETRSRLLQAGYLCVQQVIRPGEFSVRGSLVDLYPPNADYPIRIDLFDDEIDSLRYFDPESQTSLHVTEQITLLPAREFPLTHTGIDQFRKNFLSVFPNRASSGILQQVEKGLPAAGIEYYLPLFFEETATLFDYLPANSRLIRVGKTEQAVDRALDYVSERFTALSHQSRPLLPPEYLNLAKNELFAALKPYPVMILLEESVDEARKGHWNLPVCPLPPIALEHRRKDPASALKDFIASHPGHTLITARSSGRLHHLETLLQRHGLNPQIVEGWNQVESAKTGCTLTVAPLDRGLICTEDRITIITETDILGEAVPLQSDEKPARVIDPETILTNLTELEPGSPVVHEDHGVGRYRGLEKISVQDSSPEFLVIEYAKGDRLYVPVSDLHRIHRYSGADSEHAPLHKLGGEEWTRVRKRAQARIRDVASELLEVYARREMKKGYAFPRPGKDYETFCETFPFEETPDQLKTISEIIDDMCSDKPMDRLVCGDVGFGKTEVAMRAAFLAASHGKQVAVLVPTTLLAQQHEQSFRDRFADWPIRIELLSRFGSKKETDAKLDALVKGKVDIVIGTHKLLQKSVKFHDLGLFILDEEHRFGVRQKDYLKSLRHEVDVLSLTATPIPRTLNMSLSGIRDLSLIATPPAHRHAIQTVVSEWDDEQIRDACLRELHRGGQVYVLHNEVKTLPRIVEQLEILLPDARIHYAHGQMREHELERIMQDFYHQHFNILVCTTIIESGIDNPNANTMIINRADKLGLSQLYQIRGRVGRSHHQAYAYLLRPPVSMMTKDAEKRLDAISSIHDLGAGFILATHDLEIRGAGELLGEEQSGQIQAIGFSMYSQLLERAVASMQRGELKEDISGESASAEIKSHLPSLLPEDYIDDPHVRLVLYKRMANASSERELDNIQIELIDRFGLLPDSAKLLFRLHELRIRADSLGISRIELDEEQVSFDFREETPVQPETLIALIQTNPLHYRFNGESTLVMDVENASIPPQDAALQVMEFLQDSRRKIA